MNKLLTITLRWMRRDKKRTLLSFLSIVMAMYMLTFLGIYFSAGVSMMRAVNAYESGDWHVSFRCDSFEQADLITKNVSVEKGGVTASTKGFPFLYDFVKRYIDKKDDSRMPSLMINGINVFSLFDGNENMIALASGDMDTLYREAGSPNIEGHVPSKNGEILLTSELANKLGVKVGDTVTFRYGAQKVNVKYAELRMTEEEANENIEETEMLPDGGIYKVIYNRYNKLYHDLREKGTDLDGNPVEEYKPDTDGTVLSDTYKDIFDMEFKDTSTMTHSELDAYLDEAYSRGGGFELVHTMAEIGDSETTPDVRMFTDPETGDRIIRAVKYELLDDTDTIEEHSFTVSGITKLSYSDKLGKICFYAGDSDITKYFPCENYTAYVRIRDGLDIDTETRQIRASVGLPEDEPMARSRVDQNDQLIFLEGRGFERTGNVALLFALIIIIVCIFVFFARLIINNAFELSNVYRLTQYGALKTVGTSDRQIFAMVMIECLMHMIAALPIAVILAFVTGRLVLDRISDLKIFDLVYGDGVSDKFMKLEIKPFIMVSAVAVAIFSVVMSAYACAIRIRKLSPIEAATTGRRSKKVKAKKQGWLSRKLFGFSVGYAVRSVRKHLMSFSITALAAIVSGTLIITLATLTRTVDLSVQGYSDSLYDFEVFIDNNNSPDMPAIPAGTIPAEIEYLKDTGLFSYLGSSNLIIYSSNALDKQFCDLVSEKYSYSSEGGDRGQFQINIRLITRDQYADIKTDVSYDDLIASKGMLISGTVSNLGEYRSESTAREQFCVEVFGTGDIPEGVNVKTVKVNEGGEQWLMPLSDDVPVFTSLPESVTIPMKKSDDGKTLTVNIRGMFTTDDPGHAGQKGIIYAVFPVEALDALMKESPAEAELIQSAFTNHFFSVDLNAGEDKGFDARDFLRDRYTAGDIGDHLTEKLTNERVSKACKTAGYSLAAVIFALALINMLSTSAASIVNRSEEMTMLRACGMSLRQVMGSVAAEAVFSAVIPSLISAGLSVPLSNFLMAFLDTSADERVHFSFIAAGLIFLLTLAATLLPSLLTLITLSRKPIAENIRKKE